VRLLAGAVLALCVSCSSGPGLPPPVDVNMSQPPAELRKILESIRQRTDVQAMMARARIYNRLRELERSVSPSLLALGDAADIDTLSHGAPKEFKVESASRLAAHFRERADNPVLSRSSFPGHLGEPLRRIVLLTVAVSFAEMASRREFVMTLEKVAAVTLSFADREALSPEAVVLWRKRAGAAAARAAELGKGEEPLEASADARSFCESEPARHLEEGTRSADLGTREKANRGELGGTLQWYVLALAHYAVVRETVLELSPAQEHALAAQEIVVRSLCDLICREP
jgi:hypothetical protein